MTIVVLLLILGGLFALGQLTVFACSNLIPILAGFLAANWAVDCGGDLLGGACLFLTGFVGASFLIRIVWIRLRTIWLRAIFVAIVSAPGLVLAYQLADALLSALTLSPPWRAIFASGVAIAGAATSIRDLTACPALHFMNGLAQCSDRESKLQEEIGAFSRRTFACASGISTGRHTILAYSSGRRPSPHANDKPP